MASADPTQSDVGAGAEEHSGAPDAPTVWVVHRHDAGRRALVRLAGPDVWAVEGAPADDLSGAATPELVVLGLAGDFEQELEFAHRILGRLPTCSWILVPERGEEAEAARLFDVLPAEILSFPPDPVVLRDHIHAALRARRSPPLSRRRDRDRVAERFVRWFADLDLPDVVRALDPHLWSVPVWLQGEPGSGRALLARYLHEFGGGVGGAFVQVPCGPQDGARELLGRIRDAAASSGADDAAWTLWLEEADRLPSAAQHWVQSWIEFGLPAGAGRAPAVRWVLGTADIRGRAGERLEPGLRQALSGLVVRIPPLRERAEAVDSLVADAALAWSRERGERLRHFSSDALAVLREYPWPGNLRELEATVGRTLASSAADPLRAEHLRLEPGGRAPAPAAAAAAGLEVDEPGRSPAGADAAAAGGGDREALRRVVGAVAHEVRNPLTSIRTFAQLLPERFDDPEFRERFAELVGEDVQRLEEVVERLQTLAGGGEAERKPVDVAALLEQLLDARREPIRGRNLLVLRELDRAQPTVLADPDQLERALAGLLDRALESVPDRGDVYLASRHHRAGLRGRPAVRVLLRFDRGGREAASSVEGVTLLEASLERITAEALIQGQGGSLTVNTADPHETVVVIDLPAPAAPATDEGADGP